MLDQVKFVEVHREKEKNREREREWERERERDFWISNWLIILKWIKMDEFCSNKIINDFEWSIIAHKKLAKINDALFLFVKELSALACGFLALGKLQINWNDENRVARPSEQDFTQRLLGMRKFRQRFSP